ncbi:MAG: hypothetical protein LJE94_12925 [Deltaproteobacteria bacterium]|nr:hypothetical protein [Deltaproteobacteria bacterium]
MNRSTRNSFVFILAGLLVAFAAACAKPYSVKVLYTLPEAPQQLQGQKIGLQVEDRRADKSVFSEKARSEFDLWNGNFTLATNEGEASSQTYDLQDLVATALKERLKAMQVEVVEDGAEALPVMRVAIEQFKIDLEGRTWYAGFAYRARLSKDSSKIARESVNGKAERAKIMGRGGGEKLIGELLTDGLNKLNVSKLFENAGLTQ